MSITFKEVISQIRAVTNFPDSKLDMIRQAVNFELEEFARLRDWNELKERIGDPLSDAVTSTASTSYLALPLDAEMPLALVDITNDYPLEEVSLEELSEDNAGLLDTNNPILRYAFMGRRPTKRPMSTADIVEVVCESASDTDIEVRIYGRRDDPNILEEEVINSNGTTAVDGTITFDKGWSIKEISIDRVGLNGYVRVRENTTATNILCEIAKDGIVPRYPIILFDNPPDTSNSLVLVYKRQIRRVFNDSDTFEIPVEHAIVQAVIGRYRELDRSYEEAAVHRASADNSVLKHLSERRLQSPREFKMRQDRDRAVPRRVR